MKFESLRNVRLDTIFNLNRNAILWRVFENLDGFNKWSSYISSFINLGLNGTRQLLNFVFFFFWFLLLLFLLKARNALIHRSNRTSSVGTPFCIWINLNKTSNSHQNWNNLISSGYLLSFIKTVLVFRLPIVRERSCSFALIILI